MNKGREKWEKKGRKRDENEREGRGREEERKQDRSSPEKYVYTQAWLCSHRVPFSEQTTVRLQGRVQAMGACAIQAKGDFCFLLPYHNVSS